MSKTIRCVSEHKLLNPHRSGHRTVVISLGLMCVATSCKTIPVNNLSDVSVRKVHLDILRAESRRDAGAEALQIGLSHHKRNIRLAALKAVSRIESPSSTSQVLALLGDRDPDVAKWAAFAAGQIGHAQAVSGLVEALSDDSIAKPPILRALGRAATASVASELYPILLNEKPKVRGSAALALGLIAKRVGAEKVKTTTISKRLSELVRSPHPKDRYGAVYALMRMPGPDVAASFTSVLSDKNPEVRAMGVRGLGESGVTIQIFDSVIKDPDWKVRYQTVRAMDSMAKRIPGLAPAVAQRLMVMLSHELVRFGQRGAIGSGTSTHILSEIVRVAGRLGDSGDELIRRLSGEKWRNLGQFSPSTQSDGAAIHCHLAFATDFRDSDIRRVRVCGSSRLLAWRRLELESRLLEFDEEGGFAGLLAMLKLGDSKTRVIATLALANVKLPNRNKVLSELLRHSDPYVVAAAASWFQNQQIANEVDGDVVSSLRAALNKMSGEPDPNFVVGLIDAIGALQVRATEFERNLSVFMNDARPSIRRRAAAVMSRGFSIPMDFGANPRKQPYRRPRPIGGRPILYLEMERGTIAIEMFGDLAPRTVGVISALANDGFYNGRSWHRIVPDFVSQGGCPRGDGWGGPGYAIEEEVSPMTFRRGAVGIATNGRDTGASQFFITHSSQPHLDGGYTLFGQVRDGMDVVDALQPDDLIKSARVVFSTPSSRKGQQR